MSSRENLIAYFESQKTAMNNKLIKFQEALERNPAHAFEWGDGALSAAAELKAIAWVLKNLTENEDADAVDRLRKYVAKQVVSRATHPQRSTSVMSNLVEQEYVAAMARIAETLSGGWV